MKFDPKDRATALLSSPAAKGRPDFADRAAACHLLVAHAPLGVDMLSLWPGRIEDFDQTLTQEQNRKVAACLMIAAE